jgi:hypothetical protein
MHSVQIRAQKCGADHRAWQETVLKTSISLLPKEVQGTIRALAFRLNSVVCFELNLNFADGGAAKGTCPWLHIHASATTAPVTQHAALPRK